MSKSIEFRIPKPCHENWQNMEPADQGKFCGACQKTVVDFSVMSDQEILQHISRLSGNVCGRFNNEQLSRPVVISNSKKFSFTYLWNIVLATAFLSLKANAQSPIVKGKVKVVQRPNPIRERTMGIVMYTEPPILLKGNVVDASDNSSIPFATIAIKPFNILLSADSLGNFKVTPLSRGSEQLIEVSAVGYESKIIRLDAEYKIDQILIVRLEKKPVELPAVVVVEFSGTSCNGIAGGLVPVQHVTVLEKWRDTISAVFANKNIRVFPNPVIKGNIIHVKFDLREMAEYELQIINSNGQILKTETFDIQAKNQVKQILIPTNYPKGVYFVRVQRPGSKEAYNRKFIVE